MALRAIYILLRSQFFLVHPVESTETEIIDRQTLVTSYLDNLITYRIFSSIVMLCGLRQHWMTIRKKG